MTKREESKIKIHVPLKNNKLLTQVVDRINQNEEIYALWKVINVNAIDRLNMSDHGPTHFQIVANIALRLSRILTKNKVNMSIVDNYDLTNDHAEVVIFLTSVMHDLGMTIDRRGHEGYSLFLANNLLHDLLNFLSTEERTILTSEILHAIISHRKDGKPMTIEAGIIRVADALDMSEGRSRIPYEAGALDIHAVSAAAIDNIDIKESSTNKPIQIIITMNNSAGIFQIDELLKSKLKGSKLEDYVSVKAYTKKGSEKKLINKYEI